MEKIKVMIAEDFKIIRDEFCNMIDSQEDMELVGSSDSAAGIIKLSKEKEVDIILMDIEMEKFDSGIEAAEMILNFNPTINIIFLTVHELDDFIFRAFTTGAVDYVVKSSPPEVILQHIRNVYNGKPFLDVNIQAKLRGEFSRLKKNEDNLLSVINIIIELTPAERELIKLLLKKNKISQIAEIRNVEIVTVKTQINSILKKFNKRRTKEIVAMINRLELEYLFLD